MKLFVWFIRTLMVYLCLSISITLMGQESKSLVLRGGMGYFADPSWDSNGNKIWLEIGTKASYGFYFNARAAQINAVRVLGSGHAELAGQISVSTVIQAGLTITRPINIYGNHYIEPGVGLFYLRGYNHKPYFEYDFNYEPETDTILFLYDLMAGHEVQNGAMANIFFDYHYQFKRGFYLGVRAETNAVFNYYILTPMLGVRF